MKKISALVAVLSLLLSVAESGPTHAEPNVVSVVRFQYLRDEMVAQVRINGHGPFSALLDTGTDPSVVDLGVARQIGLKVDSVGHSGSGGGSSSNSAYVTALPRLEIGGMTVAKVDALALDLTALSQKFGRPIQVVLGDSLFSGRVVQFDYPGRVARFYRRSPFAASPRHLRHAGVFVTLPFVHDSEIHLRGVRVNGKPVVGNLDTGSNSEFQLTPDAIKRLGLQRVADHAVVEQAAGFNGKFESRVGTVRSVQVGTILVKNPPTTFWRVGTGHDRPWDVNIGNEFWRDYVVTVDYQRDVVTVEKR